MRTIRSKSSFLTALAMIVGIMTRCGSLTEPVVDGGTHTGNPELVACVEALFDALETGDEWRVDYYVTAEDLDPAGIDPTRQSRTLSKRLSGAVAIASDTISVGDTIIDSDTIIIENTDVRSDTSVETETAIDTINGTIEGVAVTYTIESLVFDTIIAIDTLVSYDTIYLHDTLVFKQDYYFGEMDSASPESTKTAGPDSSWFPADSGTLERTEGSPFRNSSSAAVVGKTSDTLSAQLVSSLTQSYIEPQGTEVMLGYRDADGNGTLYEADSGRTPAAILTKRQFTGAARVELVCLFTAGADERFASVADNTIHSLVHYRYTDEMLDERVLFAGFRQTEKSVADKTLLFRFAPSDTIRYGKTEYWTSGDYLIRLRHLRVFGRVVQGIDSLVFSFQEISKSGGQPLTNVQFDADVYLSDGGVGDLTGVIDTSDGLVGDYSVGGKTYHVKARSRGAVTVEPVELE
ncbi:MAG: hypothetical protein GF344_05775 [Chitinivibrionales bacterium]|nr:hypothetical protein [Chitinivibrionales bacterium]MBD3356474.1 hypothetical protein [Chitinivibrionales bacterium]